VQTYQDMISALQAFWQAEGCVIMQPYHTEVGAGTSNPATFLRVLGPRPWRTAYVEPSIRPDDGRYGENPYRFQQFFQYQVILKPAPDDSQDVYLRSLAAIGIDPLEHDIRFVEDNWESPSLGAWGLGWEVWMDGMEITQFTYFQQAGGIELEPGADPERSEREADARSLQERLDAGAELALQLLRIGALEPHGHVRDRGDAVEVDEDGDEALLALPVVQRLLEEARLPVLPRRVEADVMAADGVVEEAAHLGLAIDDVLRRDRPRGRPSRSPPTAGSRAAWCGRDCRRTCRSCRPRQTTGSIRSRSKADTCPR